MKLVKEPSSQKAVESLKKGLVLALPTDTVYGLFADAFNKKAVRRIFEMKKRDLSKPIGIFVKDLEMARRLAVIDKKNKKFFKKYLPGRVTLIFKQKREFSRGVGTEKTIGIRIPDFSFFDSLFEKISFPLAQTSANTSGRPVLKTGRGIYSQFKKGPFGPDLVWEAGKLENNQPSTVVDLTAGKPKIVREGAVEVDLC